MTRKYNKQFQNTFPIFIMVPDKIEMCLLRDLSRSLQKTY